MANWSQRLVEAEEMYLDRSADLEEAEGALANVLAEIERTSKTRNNIEQQHRGRMESLTSDLREAETLSAKATASHAHMEKQKASLEENYQSLFRKATSVKGREAAVAAREEQQAADLEARVEAIEADEARLMAELDAARAESDAVEAEVLAVFGREMPTGSIANLTAAIEQMRAKTLFWQQGHESSKEHMAATAVETTKVQEHQRHTARVVRHTCKAITLA